MVPPRSVRRLVLAPAIPQLTVLLVVSLPLTLISAAVASTFLPGRWRALRVLYFLLIGLAAAPVPRRLLARRPSPLSRHVAAALAATAARSMCTAELPAILADDEISGRIVPLVCTSRTRTMG